MPFPLNYEGAGKSGPEGQDYIRILNNTGGTILNGAVYMKAYLTTIADTTNPIISVVPVAVATVADAACQMLVIDDPTGSILNGAYGRACIKGYTIALVDGTTDVTAGDGISVLNAGTAFVFSEAGSSGATGALLTITSAVVLETYTTNSAALKKICLLGRQVTVA